jgi:hypothetical protein
LRFNSLGKSEENLCRFAAADAVGEAEFTDPVQDKINRPNGDQTINNLDDPAIMRDLTPADPNKHFPTF